LSGWLSFTSIAASTNVVLTLIFFPYAEMAFRSLGKQEPPQPRPGRKNSAPILLSRPIPFATSSTSAPVVFWQRLAIMLMKLTFIARNELFAYLVSSAFSKLVLIIGGVFSPKNSL